MSDSRFSRRKLLSGTTVAAAGLAAVGGCAATRGTGLAAGASAAKSRRIGPNDRVSIGIIGCGGRGSQLMQDIHDVAKDRNAEITAVCDVWKVNLNVAAAKVKEWFGKQPRASTRFGDILALDDVDAVVIATPDFGHTPIMIEALKAGKDVYVEKPMSMEIAEANQALDLARKHERVVQVGTQRRSEGRFKGAAKEFSTGILGKLNRISAAMNVNHPRWARSYADCKQSDVDWDAFLFNRPKRPFDPSLLRQWHFYKLCTNGLSGLWMAHYSDSVHMVTGAKYPTSAVAHGGIYVWKDGREHTDTFHALLDYPEGFLMSWGMGLANSHGVHFDLCGTEATMDLEKWVVSGEGGAGVKKMPARPLQAEPSESHMGNWIDCIRSRKRPNADIEYGHQHAVATIMAAAALETGRRHVYDPVRREMRPG
ncbi:MAG TPA: Gfo/Idh/MocA family oxidoreductase [Phycisphaerae bacterium]|nr:Gfo/Idh/MocA family oxidoreductase [Phycisphaerae bacterium]HRR85625.1 Gfo/Idh/MocA family oxidoreductase [Phycisphaerae bacterium]